MKFKRARCPGFSLVELLVVIAIIGIVTGLAVPAFSSTMRAANLRSAGRVLIDQFNMARQMAQSRNLATEVRLYKLPDYNQGAAGTPTVYRGIQIFLVKEDGSKVPSSPVEYFQSPIAISSDTSYSSLLAEASTSASPHAEKSPGSTDPKLGSYAGNYRYIPFQFLPSGLTDLSSGKNFVTLVIQNDKPLSQGANFFTVQVDCINGSVRSVRP
jgi:uncharacterized protein (TIGR02596 family)